MLRRQKRTEHDLDRKRSFARVHRRRILASNPPSRRLPPRSIPNRGRSDGHFHGPRSKNRHPFSQLGLAENRRDNCRSQKIAWSVQFGMPRQGCKPSLPRRRRGRLHRLRETRSARLISSSNRPQPELSNKLRRTATLVVSPFHDGNAGVQSAAMRALQEGSRREKSTAILISAWVIHWWEAILIP